MSVLLLLTGAACSGDDDDFSGTPGGSSSEGDAFDEAVQDEIDDLGESEDEEDGIEACPLLDVADVEAVYPELGPWVVDDGGGDTCWFNTESGASLVFTTDAGDQWEELSAEEAFDQFKEGKVGIVDLDGLGDEAFLSWPFLFFRIDDKVFDLFLPLGPADVDVDDEELEARLPQLAELIVSRL